MTTSIRHLPVTALRLIVFTTLSPALAGTTKVTIAQQLAGQHSRDEAQEQRGTETIDLVCHPLATPFQLPLDPSGTSLTSIQVTGEVSQVANGSGHLTVGSSIYEFNEFGDASEVEVKPSHKIEVELTRLYRHAHRSLFELTSPKLKAGPRVFLQWQNRPPHSSLLIGDPQQTTLGSLQLAPVRIVPLQDRQPSGHGDLPRQPLRDNIHMFSSYFPTNEPGLGKLGHISVLARLRGTGSLTHDKNHIALHWSQKNAGLSITALAFKPHQILLAPVTLPDPTNQNRRLFRVMFANDSPLGEVFLVTYPDAAGPHRLIIRKNGRTEWVLPLSPSGLEPWLDLAAASEQLPSTERDALAQITAAVPLNFFHEYGIRSGHVFRISLTGANVRRGTLAQLPKLSQLQHLHIAYSSTVDPTALSQALSELSTVKHLSLHDLPFTTGVAGAIGRMPSLESLALYNDTESPLTDNALEHISKSPRLRRLHVSAQAATDEGLLHLARLPHLTNLDLYAPQATKEGINRLRTALPPNCEARINQE
jgi:hypothetical protein